MLARWALLIAVGLGSTASGCVGAGDAPTIVASVAISVADVVRAVADDYEGRTGVRVVINSGGSDTLATQLLAGARVDLFVSADDRQMNRVEAGGALVSSTRVDLLANQLVVVTTHDRVSEIGALEALVGSGVRRIAMGDPAAVPAGVYARRYLQSVGVWDVLEAKVVPTRNVRAALAAVEAGNADVGFVYRTDLSVASGVGLSFAVPIDVGPAIRYPAAVTTDATDEAAARHFLQFLQGPDAGSLFVEAGFIPVGIVSP